MKVILPKYLGAAEEAVEARGVVTAEDVFYENGGRRSVRGRGRERGGEQTAITWHKQERVWVWEETGGGEGGRRGGHTQGERVFYRSVTLHFIPCASDADVTLLLQFVKEEEEEDEGNELQERVQRAQRTKRAQRRRTGRNDHSLANENLHPDDSENDENDKKNFRNGERAHLRAREINGKNRTHSVNIFNSLFVWNDIEIKVCVRVYRCIMGAAPFLPISNRTIGSEPYPPTYPPSTSPVTT